MLFLRKQGVSMGAGVDLLKMVSETRALKGEGGKSVGDWDPLDVGGSSAGKTNQEKTDLENKAEKEEKEEEELQEESRGVGLALSLLKFYKGNISPLLPPSCRYLPTCSEYAMDSFKEFGFAKGGVLTAWRLARCNPLGGSGYDPPKWPPPGLEWLIEFLEKKYAGESVLAISCILAAIFAVQRTHPF
ncbi:hypothetical protein BSKO_09546 [Bryopsis sp. KO-2023]|nr:hypothetical protein BSKO_09546 [Bryopsis sp. KO-2023]